MVRTGWVGLRTKRARSLSTRLLRLGRRHYGGEVELAYARPGSDLA